MIQTIHLSDDIDVGELPKETGHFGVDFENLYHDNVSPKGYMSSKEFRKRAFEKVNKFCDKHEGTQIFS
jgi:hypothetical protein